MAGENKTRKPRIFISHSWEDKTLARRLENDLKKADAEVWVDHSEIRGGDNLPIRISDALEWCNTLLLLWSKTARDSRWVKLEWSNAISLDRSIIPCLVENISLPGILAHMAYLDFRKPEQGIAELLRALDLSPKPAKRPTGDRIQQVARVLHETGKFASTSPKSKPSQVEKVLHLRQQPVEDFTGEAVKDMLREKGFFDKSWNKKGKGIRHQYEAIERAGQRLVIDHATGLTWQQSGSSDWMKYANAEKYIRDLNDQRFAGFADWRLPTLEEAMSLMRPTKNEKSLYIDPRFDSGQQWIWTSDKAPASRAWVVYFNDGYCYLNDCDFSYGIVRAVRRGQSTL